MPPWPFDPNVERNTWTTVRAQGFPDAVPGCVYEGSRLDGGVPLGGLGTGYLTLEGDGRLGRASIFNDIVPPKRLASEWLFLRIGRDRLPLSSAEILYWGHYPVADLVASFPRHSLDIGIRACSPFLPGDAPNSNIPAALFEIELTNRSAESTELSVELHLPASSEQADGVALLGPGLQAAHGPGSPDGEWHASLAPGQSQRFRAVFSWYFPHWHDSGREPHVHRYGTRYPSARAVAQDVLGRFDGLVERTLRWQHEIYRADLPAWLRDVLVQSLYSLAKNSVWIARTRHDEWWSEDGWFTHSESHTGCPITETMVCRMHGHFPLLFFFPELEETTLRAFEHFQIADGEIPFSYGLRTSLRDPRYHCQHPLNSGQYAQMVYRLYARTGDKRILEHFYGSAKRAIQYQFGLDDDGDGLVNDQAHVRPGDHWPANQFYDIWPWKGTSAYVAGTWLATLACGRSMAELTGDTAFAAECSDWIERGKAAYDQKLWTGSYYRLWSDPESGEQSDVSLGNQLMSDWCTQVAGLEGVLPEKHIRSALGEVARLNMAATAHGLVNGVTPDGERFDSGSGPGDHAKHTFVGESLCAAMTFVYRGETDTGTEIARRIFEAVFLISASPWNQRCLINAETGLPAWGDDYYSNMVVWAFPMALAGADLQAFAGPEGLIAAIVEAARDANGAELDARAR